MMQRLHTMFFMCRVFSGSVWGIFFFFYHKDNANREQDKMNSFIFYAEVQLIFAFVAKIMQTESRIK